MKKTKPVDKLTKRTLFYWIRNRYRGLQLVLILAILVSLFFKVFPLEMQRRIINEAISLRDVELLFVYCGLYMGAVLVAGLLKYFINTFQAVIGQKILIEMRQELYTHILQLPLTFYHRTQAGTIISAMTAELNAIGTFIGGAIAVPVIALSTFAVFAGYMIYLNPFLGLISMTVYPFELIVVPLLQRRYNHVNQTRVVTTRAMASMVNEAISGIHEVQGNSSYGLEQSKLDRLIVRLYAIMNRLSILKYGIKFSNNLFQSLGPFLLFLIGGYLAIHGDFTIGALVAFLSAYEKVYDPWKEAIEYYQGYQDSLVRYQQIMETFDLEPEFLLGAPEDIVEEHGGSISARNITYTLENGVRLIDEDSFELQQGQLLALVGFSGSGKSTLSLLLGQLYKRSGGILEIDNRNIDSFTKLDISRTISFVAQHPFIFTGTVRDNLLYSCNALYIAGVLDDIPERSEIIRIIDRVGMAEDIIRWGLRTIIKPEVAFQLVDKLLRMRQIALQELKAGYGHVIEFYDPHRFLEHSSIAVNLIFSSYPGTPGVDRLMENHEFRSFLEHSGFESRVLKLGYAIARSTQQFLGDFRGDEFFFRGSPMEPDQLPLFAALVRKAEDKGLERLKKKEKEALISLGLLFTPGQHKIYTISSELKQDIVDLRKTFLENVLGMDLETCRNGVLQRTIYDMNNLPEKKDRLFFTPYCASQYLYTHSLLDNIIFGTVIEREMVRATLAPVLLTQFREQDLLDEIFEIGLNFHVGSKGDNLSGGQKQKIAIARAFLKNSPIIILDEATASLDNSSQAKIQRYIDSELKGRTTVIAVVHRLDMISGYDNILVMKNGQIIEAGTYSQLMEQHGALYGLVNDN